MTSVDSNVTRLIETGMLDVSAVPFKRTCVAKSEYNEYIQMNP